MWLWRLFSYYKRAKWDNSAQTTQLISWWSWDSKPALLVPGHLKHYIVSYERDKIRHFSHWILGEDCTWIVFNREILWWPDVQCVLALTFETSFPKDYTVFEMSCLVSYLCVTWGLSYHSALLDWLLFHLQNGKQISDGKGDEIGDKIEYRGLVSSIATISPPCTHQTMPYSVIWRKKTLNQLSLVSFLIIKMKTRTKYWRSLPFENLFPGNISSSPSLCFFCRSWLQSASCIRTQHHPIILLWTD